MKSEKQKEILEFLSKVPSATLNEIYTNVSFGYYHNAHKHLGEVMSRLVKSGKVERLKKGTFKFVSFAGKKNAIPNTDNQTSLF